MKFIHTADWHLGKLFYGEYLTEEQEWLLKNQFLPLVDEENRMSSCWQEMCMTVPSHRRKRWSFLTK